MPKLNPADICGRVGEHEFRSVVDAPVAEVFGWHARPGALLRLAPPWQPARVLAEARSLRDGAAILQLPGGVRWVAQHDPAAYVPDEQFADELTSLPLGPLLRWRHVHRFAARSPGVTEITDDVTTTVPARLLRPMFAYRARQLAADLAAHRSARALRATPLTVAMTGSSGLIGSQLAALLTGGGHRVIRLVRHPATGPDERSWDPADPDPGLLRGTDALVHLAGASIAGRFTAAHKSAMVASRLGPTRRLAEIAATTGDGPAAMIVASAIGYYGADRGGEALTEFSAAGDGFLADLVADWEQASGPAAKAGLRTVQVRTGIVQSPRGGALRPMVWLARAGLRGRLGSGRQWVSWIGIDDLLDIYYRALVDTRLEGPVNATAPQPVRDAEYARLLGRVLSRPLQLPVPGAGPRLILGSDGAAELAEANQRVLPHKLTGIGHSFRHAELEPALRHLLGRATPAAVASG